MSTSMGCRLSVVWVVRFLIVVLLVFSVQIIPNLFAQTELATVFGRVTDQSGAVIPGAEIEIRNVETNLSVVQASNDVGLYTIPSLHPGHYVISVRKQGFKTVSVTDLTLNVQDNVIRNFILQVGSVSESVTVTAEESEKINTTDASVSTVVDRQFAENLPMNGRSFQTLIDLTPGVVVTSASFTDPGQFSVNGQRASANYLMVDGVSANIGVAPTAGLSQTAAGSAAGFSVQGGTNSLVSVDAMQEFRIETSTYAPEFGRTPGAQISIVTRSGTNQFHGALFDFFRNDALDANNWFSNKNKLPKSKERQNDFGGVLGGPIWKDKTFFFFSYEGLRLRLPQTGISTVPSIRERQAAPTAIQPFLNGYPVPSGPETLDASGNPTGQSPFNASFSNPATLNATSLRIDQALTHRLSLFGRYNYASSDLAQRGAGGLALSSSSVLHIGTQTLTLGNTWNITNSTNNDFRFNYSRNSGAGQTRLDTFGGAVVPSDSALFPAPFTSKNSQFIFAIFSLQGSNWTQGNVAHNVQRQLNFIDNFSWQKGSHSLKFGVDYRRLSPTFGPLNYAAQVGFLSVPSVLSGVPFFTLLQAGLDGTVLFHNLGAFAQDTWRVLPRLTVTYGLRWDVDFAPSSASGPSLLAVTNFDNPTSLALAPAGTPLFKTPYGSVGPRIGLAYQLSQNQRSQTVLRGGFGVFYDLASQQVGDALFRGFYPFGASKITVGGGTFPLTPAEQAPPAISVSSLAGTGQVVAFDPNLKLPYTLQWNVGLEQALGGSQTLTASYVGALGRRLIQQEQIIAPNSSFGQANLISNRATSDYHSLQLQFERRLAHGLQVLTSYTWGHSIDTASSSSLTTSNRFVSGLGANANRGPSDFDIRHSLSAGVTYDIPSFSQNAVVRSALGHWSLENVILARSAPPVNIFYSQFARLFNNNATQVRPDVVPGQPLYLSGPLYPGGKAINCPISTTRPDCTGQFSQPPVDPATKLPSREGNLGRNALRGFGAVQWDFAVHREFPIHEQLKLQFRAEMFNVINHPNFGQPSGDLSAPQTFGQSTQTLGQSLGGGSTAAGLSPLYQIGGPRSIQLALKLIF